MISHIAIDICGVPVGIIVIECGAVSIRSVYGGAGVVEGDF